MAHQDVRVALVGISGFGDLYLDALLNDPRSEALKLVGVADPNPLRCKRLDDLRARSVPVSPTIEHLFATAGTIDLAMIATPIHLHAPQTCFALQRGASVLCEKPLAGSVADALRMAECARAAAAGGQFVAIGYQWSFSDAVRALKRDMMAGAFGRAVRLKTVVYFPRAQAYFRRNDWAGRLRSASGAAVLDSPVNNATAHYLHNMLYLIGRSPDRSATPARVQAELYRANEIENYDTAALRVATTCGAEILFYTTHAVTDRFGPVCRFEFERATVEYDHFAAGGGEFVARLRDGSVRRYGQPDADRNAKIWQCAEATRTGEAVACGIAGAMPHTVCVAAAQRSVPAIAEFPAALKQVRLLDGQPMVCVAGLAEALLDCYDRGVLPAEHGGLAWARAGTPIEAPAADAGAMSQFLAPQVAAPSGGATVRSLPLVAHANPAL